MRCLIDVPGEKLPASLAEHLRTAVAPQIPEVLQQSFLEAIRQGRIRSMQNKLMPAAPLHRPGALLLGDAFNMRHPLTGSLACSYILKANQLDISSKQHFVLRSGVIWHGSAGGGMTVALSDTQLLCNMLRPLHSFKNAAITADTTSEFYTTRKPLSATINTLANALYQVHINHESL